MGNDSGRLIILQGDALAVLRTLPAGLVHCCVTSPPYWGLRDYGVADQLGLESTPEAYVARLVEVFREVKRVLRSDGTCWIVIADSYASGKGTCYNPGGGVANDRRVRREIGWRPTCDHGLPPMPCIVLDPFLGAGTTLLVARRLGRSGVGSDLRASYCDLARNRLKTTR